MKNFVATIAVLLLLQSKAIPRTLYETDTSNKVNIYLWSEDTDIAKMDVMTGQNPLCGLQGYVNDIVYNDDVVILNKEIAVTHCNSNNPQSESILRIYSAPTFKAKTVATVPHGVVVKLHAVRVMCVKERGEICYTNNYQGKMDNFIYWGYSKNYDGWLYLPYTKFAE